MRTLSTVLEAAAVLLVAVVLFTFDWRFAAVWVALVMGVLSWFLERSGDEHPSPNDPGDN